MWCSNGGTSRRRRSYITWQSARHVPKMNAATEWHLVFDPMGDNLMTIYHFVVPYYNLSFVGVIAFIARYFVFDALAKHLVGKGIGISRHGHLVACKIFRRYWLRQKMMLTTTLRERQTRVKATSYHWYRGVSWRELEDLLQYVCHCRNYHIYVMILGFDGNDRFYKWVLIPLSYFRLKSCYQLMDHNCTTLVYLTLKCIGFHWPIFHEWTRQRANKVQSDWNLWNLVYERAHSRNPVQRQTKSRPTASAESVTLYTYLSILSGLLCVEWPLLWDLPRGWLKNLHKQELVGRLPSVSTINARVS